MEKIYQLYLLDENANNEIIETYVGDAGLKFAIHSFDKFIGMFDMLKVYECEVSPFSGKVVEGKTICFAKHTEDCLEIFDRRDRKIS